MLASTAFYGTIRTFREFGSVIVDIDTKMTELKKVMADGTDFGKIFVEATNQAEKFGQTISSTLDSYAMFAKQGFKGQELLDLTSAGLVAGNVGDIDTGKASEYLTASLLQWNKETSEAMGIVDSWNEISNNYATTVENLAQGHAKAGSTAKALGLTFNELSSVVGVMNARTKQSGNEIGNFLKSTMPNLLTNKGKGILASLGVSLEDEQGNLRNIMDVYKDVAKEYKKLSQAEQNQVTLGLGGKYHIARLQTLLDDLGSVDSMYDQMLKSSENSANSAMDENEKYMQSLEARMNQARVEVEKLAISIGEAVMTDAMIAGMQIFGATLSAIASVVDKLGVLPITLLLITGVLTKFSRRFGDIVTGIGTGEGKVGRFVASLRGMETATKETTKAKDAQTRSERHNTVATDENTRAKAKSASTAKILSKSFIGLSVVTFGLGVIIEAVVKWYGKAREAKEKMIAKNREEMKSYSDNRDSINELIGRYKELSKQEFDVDTDGYKELISVQNELGELMPDLIKGETEYGNKVLHSAQQAELKVEALEKELEIQRKLNIEKAKDEQIKEEKSARKTISKGNSDAEAHLAQAFLFASKMNKVIYEFDESISVLENVEFGGSLTSGKSLESLADVEQALENIKIILVNKDKHNLTDGAVAELKQTEEGLRSVHLQLVQAQADIATGMNVIKKGFTNDLEEIADVIGDFSKDGRETFDKFTNTVIALAETEDDLDMFKEAVNNALGTKGSNSAVEKDMNSLMKTISELKNSGITDAQELEAKYGVAMKGIRDSILKSMVASGVEKNSVVYKSMQQALNDLILETEIYKKDVNDLAVSMGITVEEAKALIDANEGVEGSTSDVNEEIEKEIEKIKELSSAIEKVVGVSKAQVEKTDELIFIFNELSSKTERTARENEVLAETVEKLRQLYPHLGKQVDIRIKDIELENETVKSLQEAYELAEKGLLNTQEKMTMNTTQQAVARVSILREEIKALVLVVDQQEKASIRIKKQIEEAKQTNKQTFIDMTGTESKNSFWFPPEQELMDKTLELEGILSGFDSIKDAIQGVVDSSNARQESDKKSSKSSKDATKEQSELQKITEKYALTLDKLNTALAEVQAKQKKYPTYSKQYRKALEDENSLIQQQIDLNNQKTKELNNVKPTILSDGGSGSNIKPAGFGGAITSNFGKRGNANHIGIDIDGAIGDLLQANIAGKVTSKGNNSVSGNYVYVMDSKGLEHFYAHLDTIAVSTNQLVDVGTKLGTIGNTGNVVKGKDNDGSHLHYGVKQDGKWIDPSGYAQVARSGSQASSPSTLGGSAESIVWNYFKSKGLNDSAISGIMGNIAVESNFNSKAVNKSSGASGIFQWLGSRKKELQNYASSLGKSWDDITVQLDFAWKELNSTEKKSLTSLQSGGLSASDHASEFDRLFERSGRSAVDKRKTNANQYYSQFAGTSGGSGGGVDNSDMNDALSQIENLKQSNVALAEKLQENYFKGVKSRMEEFQRGRSIEDIGIAKQEEMQKNMLKHSKAYEDSINKQYNAENRKLKSYEDEYAYINTINKAGGLTLAQQDELLDRRLEIQKVMLETQNQIKAYYNEVIESRLAGFDNTNNSYLKTLEWEETKIQSLAVTNGRYTKTLDIMARTRKNQIAVAQDELKYVNSMLNKGNLTSEMYENLTQRAFSLKNEMIQLNEALHDVNMQLIQTIATIADLKIDDIDFQISYSQALRGLYEEGSGDFKKALDFELTKLTEKLELVKQKGIDIQNSMKDKDLGHARLQELEEQLEDNALAFLDVQSAIKGTKKALEDFGKTIEDQIKEKRGKLADDIIKALKDAISEAKDIQLGHIDDLIDAEQERHDSVMKQYDDELSAYTKIIDAKRREINDKDRDRSHGNKLGELNTEKQELQNRLNLLSNVNTYEGKKEKEELQKQIAVIEKQIVEEKYQHEKNLQVQQLDDLLENKTEHIEDLKEKEDEHSSELLKTLNKQKKYWEKHYSDLLNNESKFAKMREDILAGNFKEVEKDFAEHIKLLTDSLPALQDRFDGTWKAVGTQIRENVIGSMQDLLLKIKEVEAEIQKLNSLKTSVTGEFGGISNVDQTVENANKGNQSSMSEADMKVILAKFMNEQIAGSLNPVADKSRIANIKAKATNLAKEGRDEGSTINADKSLGSIFDGMSSTQLKQLGGYFQTNSSSSEFSTKEYIDYIESFGKSVEQGKLLTTGDKQVMLAKYIRENIVPATKDTNQRASMMDMTDKLAESGRKNTSMISASVGYDQSIQRLSEKQQAELGRYMLDNSNVIAYPDSKLMLTRYADNLMRNMSNDFTGLDTGGMIKGIGASGGVDGKGGKLALLHQNEVVSNPIDTVRMLKVSSIMENIMRTINGAIALPTLSRSSVGISGNSTENSTVININIDKMNGSKNDIDNLGKQIQNRLLREKGKR